MATPVPLILASASPRRRDLLAAAGWFPPVVVSPVEEIHDPAMPPAELVGTNARLKAEDVSRRHPDALVLGADTLVVIDGEPLGKPADRVAAAAMLARLGGRRHEVFTGVCLARGGAALEVFHVASRVRFAPLDAAVIARYHALVDPLDKAGAYGLQDHVHLLGARVEGSLSNVIGLPVEETVARLAAAGARAGDP
jgi:septum formation protein